MHALKVKMRKTNVLGFLIKISN